MPDNEFDVQSDTSLIYVFCAAGCVICAALAAGMTVGLLSLDSLKLKIKAEVGKTEEERKAAKQILPVIANHHLLLCTLLLFNAMANEALPIFLDAIVPSWAAVVISVTLVLICGEVIPSALFTGPNQLYIAARFIGLIYFLEGLFFPVAWPMAKGLDWILGHEEDDHFNRDEISALVKIMREKGAGQIKQYLQEINHNERLSGEQTMRRFTTAPILIGGEDSISHQEANVITGVLGLSKIFAKDVCIKMKEVAMLSTDQVLDRETLDVVDKVGYSRLPVFKGGDVTHIVGYLIVKRLINTNPDLATPVSSIALTEPVVVGAKQTLLDVLKIFQSGFRHIALVSEKPKELMQSIHKGEKPSLAAAPIGILTVEDVFEQMIQAQITDEDDRDKSMLYESASNSLREMSMRSSTASLKDFDAVPPVRSNVRSKSGTRSLSTALFGKGSFGKDPISEPLIGLEEGRDQDDNNDGSMAFSFLKEKGLTASMVTTYRKNAQYRSTSTEEI